MRNDLAETYLRLNRKADCLRVLDIFIAKRIAETAADKKNGADNDGPIVKALVGGEPIYYDWARETIQTARTNLKACGYKFPK